MLLIDEIDRADEAFEAFLLELLSDFQISIPEMGTIHARHIPYVILTSNRTRELSDALKRRCLYHWIDYPTFEKEMRIVRTRLPDIEEELSKQIGAFRSGCAQVGSGEAAWNSRNAGLRAGCRFAGKTSAERGRDRRNHGLRGEIHGRWRKSSEQQGLISCSRRVPDEVRSMRQEHAEQLAASIVDFCRFLRTHGLPADMRQTITALEAAKTIDVPEPAPLRLHAADDVMHHHGGVGTISAALPDLLGRVAGSAAIASGEYKGPSQR